MLALGVLRINDTKSYKFNERHVIIDNHLKKNDRRKPYLPYRMHLFVSFPPTKITSYTKTNPEDEHRYHK